MKDSLGDRMKSYYESRSQSYLTRRMPVIIRVDGNAFHTLTRKMQKPYDYVFVERMRYTAANLLQSIQGCKLAYVQSDEISLLLVDYDRLETEAWFDYSVQKIVSISAGMATCFFNRGHAEMGWFDSRAFNLPREEVNNYFLWRQKDAMRNSLTMYAQSFFSHKELHGKNAQDKHEMLHSIGKNWTTDVQDDLRVGLTCYRSNNALGYVYRAHEFQTHSALINEMVQC